MPASHSDSGRGGGSACRFRTRNLACGALETTHSKWSTNYRHSDVGQIIAETLAAPFKLELAQLNRVYIHRHQTGKEPEQEGKLLFRHRMQCILIYRREMRAAQAQRRQSGHSSRNRRNPPLERTNITTKCANLFMQRRRRAQRTYSGISDSNRKLRTAR